MSRILSKLTAGTVFALLAGATVCSNTAITAPGVSPAFGSSAKATYANPTAKNGLDFKVLYPKLSIQQPSVSTNGDTTIQKFTVNATAGALIAFGETSGDVIAIPANTLCDPNKNGYGPSEWRKSCILATSSINFEAHA